MSPTSKFPPNANARLFSESGPSAPPSGVYIANIDGASRGNPGPASYAVVMRDPNGKIILELGKKLGRDTNNVAEYYALLAALDYAATHNIRALRIRSDSELLVRQMQGRYKVKSPDLKPLYERASKLTRQFEYFVVEHVRRESNREADALANLALDSGAFGPSLSPPARLETPAASRAKSVRARYTKGVFVPAAPVDLPENTEVLLDIRKPPDN
ncbi:MAG TPA: reverse transcriptase-like protein [Candidatus Acidoferrales bacterium]|jgi:probable phosphoglycerate mutase|nr:reverse transcriptase-like protein [Candidatus Acidoferrales bacterium]